MDNKELINEVNRLGAEVKKLTEAMARHSHNGLDSGRRLVYPLISKGIEVEGGVDANANSFSILIGDGFGIAIDYGIGAAVNGTVTITSQPSTVIIGGTSTNGEVGLYDASGTAAKYFKLSHTGNGTPSIETDASIVMVDGAFTGSTQSLSGAGAVNLTTLTTKITSTGANALTLADGTNGQIKILTMITDGGDATLTPTTKTGYTTIVFNDAGDGCILVFTTTKGWMVVANFGCTIA